MSLIEERASSAFSHRREQSNADRRATLLIVIGFALTPAAIFGLPGPDFWFMGGASAIAIVSGVPALLGILTRRFRGGIARILLLGGSIALVAFGARFLGGADAARVVIAYFVPAGLFAGAALTLAAPRMRAKAI